MKSTLKQYWSLQCRAARRAEQNNSLVLYSAMGNASILRDVKGLPAACNELIDALTKERKLKFLLRNSK